MHQPCFRRLLIWSAALALCRTAAAQDPAAAPASQPAAIDVRDAAAPPPGDAGSPADDAPAPQELVAASQPAAPQPAFGRAFRLDELNFQLGFESNWQQRQVIQNRPGPGPRRYHQTDKYREFIEYAGADGRGAIGGDRFLQYQFDVEWGLTQEAYDEVVPGRDQHERPDGHLLRYDVRAQFLPAGKLSGNLLASQLDDRVPRPFLPSMDRHRERYGVELNFNDAVLPMRLTYYDEYEELLADAGSPLDNERISNNTFEYEATWQPSEQHQLRLNYSYSDEKDQYSGTAGQVVTQRNYLTLDHTLQFGKENRNRLETLLRLQDEDGDLAQDQYEASPQLRLQHTDKLSTTYKFQFLRQSYAGDSYDLYRGDTGLNYQINDDWAAALGVYGLTQDFDRTGDLNEWGGNGNLSFSRENSLGRLSSYLNYTHTHQRVNYNTADGVVLSEAVTFRDPLPAYLQQQYVRPFNIVVTDAARTRTYLAGRDYLIQQYGPYTALVRVQTGQIVNGQTVLVTYTYQAATGRELGSDRIDFRIQQDFKNGWTPYYATSLQHQSIDRTRFVTYEPRDINRQRVGLRYRQKKWSAGGEYEYNDDSIDPYQAVRGDVDVTLLDRAPHTLTANASPGFYHFFGENEDDLPARQTLLLDMGVTYRCLLSADLDAAATALYRFENDSIEGETNGVDLTAGVNWKIGEFSAAFEIEYDLLDLPGSSDGSFGAWIRVRRNFPVLNRTSQ